MSKLGKVGIVIFFLFSIGAVVFALRLIGSIGESRKEIGKLTTSLENKNTELVKVGEEKRTLGEELQREKELKEEIQRKLSQKINELREEVKGEKKKKITWKSKFENLAKIKAELENRYREAQQAGLNLKAMLKESPPKVKTRVVETPSTEPSVLSKRIGGKVMVVASPFLSLELDRKVVAGLQPTLSIYQKGKMIKESATKGIRYVTLIARVSAGESLQGIRENDRVVLSLFPGVTEIFKAPRMEGEVLDVINPGFLNIDLGKEGLENVEPTLLVYRGGELFRKIQLKSMDHLTIMVEVVDNATIKGVRNKDIVRIVR